MNFNKKIIRTALSCCLAFMLGTTPLLAADQGKVEAQSQDIFAEINSPFCKGRLLRDCPSSGATQLKDEIRGMVSQGDSKSQVIKKLYERYGEDEIRAIPDAGFVGTLGWLAPFGFLIIGGGIILIWVKKNSAHTD